MGSWTYRVIQDYPVWYWIRSEWSKLDCWNLCLRKRCKMWFMFKWRNLVGGEAQTNILLLTGLSDQKTLTYVILEDKELILLFNPDQRVIIWQHLGMFWGVWTQKNRFVSEFSLLISGNFRDNVITNVPSFVDKRLMRMVQTQLTNFLITAAE